jgi:hypothetical protein
VPKRNGGIIRSGQGEGKENLVESSRFQLSNVQQAMAIA